jgi:hypothetical protein
MPRPKDETYIVDLCDETLGLKAQRGYRFDFLLGDPGKGGRQSRLPVDAYYPELNLVVEYHERQHSEPVMLFDRRATISGMTRGEQRKVYDHRREKVLPQYGIRLVVFSYQDFEHTSSKRLCRSPSDRLMIQQRLGRLTPLTPLTPLAPLQFRRFSS